MTWPDLRAVVEIGILCGGCFIVVSLARDRRDWNAGDWRFKWGSAAFVILTVLSCERLLSEPSFTVGYASLHLAWVTFVTTVWLTGTLLEYGKALTKRFTKTWVKALDYPYLALGFGGLVRLVNSSPRVAERYDLDSLGLLCLALALSVRVTKATLEVFFDKRISGS